MRGLGCPQCGAARIVRNGHPHTGKQRNLCRSCAHPFMPHPA
ncbi:hypothetical protein LAJ19_12175 [Deinococcus taeanensis]|nr:hypothetical protein LAJ19_12175 [Deinococcus taeanensis]